MHEFLTKALLKMIGNIIAKTLKGTETNLLNEAKLMKTSAVGCAAQAASML